MFARLALCLALVACLAVPASSLAFPSANPADRLSFKPIEDHRYDHAKKCRRSPMPGTLRLQSWLEANVRGQSWGIMRCEKLSRDNYSLHAAGRAIDWHLNVHDRADRRESKRLIGLLLATDRAGNEHALARRMGIQEIIWDCRSWWSGSSGMDRYSLCYNSKGRRVKIDDTSAHRDHVHIGLNVQGARGRTSFWAR